MQGRGGVGKGRCREGGAGEGLLGPGSALQLDLGGGYADAHFVILTDL